VSRLRAAFQGRRGTVLSVTLIVWALALFDLTLLPRVDTQFLAALPSKRVADVAVMPGATLVTSTNPAAPANLWILNHRGATTQVVGVQMPRPHNPRGVRHRTLIPSVHATLPALGGDPIDLEEWPGSGPALFVISSPRRSTSLRVLSLRTGRPLLESRVPLPPQKSDRRDFFLARWSGLRPDLFVVDRDVNRRRPPSPRPWSVRIYSGESGFKKLAFQTSLRKKLSKQLSERDWWLDVGFRRQPKPSLVLVTKGKRTGTGQTEVHIISGHSRFRRFTLHTGTELPERDGLTRRFIYQSERHGGAVLMTEIRRGRLSLLPIPLP
jgi:hypothetical protein